VIHQKQNVPYDTGKVKIGLLYQPPPAQMSEDEEKIQAALLGIRSPLTDAIRTLVRFGTATAVLVAIGYLFTR
jgi:hypothetical protein